jgi:hypothetical protein
MRHIKYSLNNENSTTGDIELLDNEKAILLTANRHPNNTSMIYSLFNDAGIIMKNPTFKDSVIRLSRQHFDTFKLEGTFVLGNFIKGDVFIGSWAEITVLDLYKYLEFYYQSADSEKLSIIIGLPNRRHLKIEQIKENAIRVGVVNGGYVLTQDFDPDSETGKYIAEIYRRIIENTGKEDFRLRQQIQVDKLLANVDHLITVY